VCEGEPDTNERVCVFGHLRRGGVNYVNYGGVEGRGTGWGERGREERAQIYK
jgi:hypothetical protein